jgi:hypothetical protein
MTAQLAYTLKDAVWPDAKQITLIDSIFKNYYIPPLVFAVRWDADEKEWVRTCIDGKQVRTPFLIRFSIQDF